MISNSQDLVLSQLDTSYRTIQNRIRFTPVDNIDRHTKKANIEAMKYYIYEKSHEIKKNLLLEKFNEWLLEEYPEIKPNEKTFVFDWNTPKNLPLEVIEKYNSDLTNYKNSCLLDFAERSFSGYIKTLEKTNKYLYLENN